MVHSSHNGSCMVLANLDYQACLGLFTGGFTGLRM